MLSCRRLLPTALLLALFPAPAAFGANEPPIVTFQALVSDSAGSTRRWETYPLAAIVNGQYVSLADEAAVESLLRSHPGLTFSDISPKGQICASIPVGLGPVGNAPTDPRPGILSPRDNPRDLALVVFSSSSRVSMVTAGVGIARTLPRPDEVGRPSEDPLESIRRAVGESLGIPADVVSLEKYGDFDFDGDRSLETVYIGSGVPPGRGPSDRRSLLTVVRPGVLPLPIYLFELASGARLLGVGDMNGDGLAEMVVKTGNGARDFGVEIHAWRNRTIQRVFEHRSYGCY